MSRRGLRDAPACATRLSGLKAEKAPLPDPLTTAEGSKGREAPPSKRGLGGDGLDPFHNTVREEEEVCEKENFSGSEIFHKALSLSKARCQLKASAM